MFTRFALTCSSLINFSDISSDDQTISSSSTLLAKMLPISNPPGPYSTRLLTEVFHSATLSIVVERSAVPLRYISILVVDLSGIYITLLCWCWRWESNPHVVKHRNLNPACLPIPSLQHINPVVRGTELRC